MSVSDGEVNDWAVIPATTKAWFLDELRDAILDYRHDDTQALVVCSLKCT